jgi:hypothetical protein
MYDRAEVVRLGDAEELAETARNLRASVLSWIQREHPKLYPVAKN